MTIFRGPDGALYNIYIVTPPRYLGRWREAVDIYTKRTVKVRDMAKYTPIASR